MTNRLESTKMEDQLCKRCQNDIFTQNIRSENVCGKCFTTYITTKAIKSMSKYRLRGKGICPKKLLFPLSFGPCSTSLLYILDGHLQGQLNKMNRVTYELVVVHIDLYPTTLDREFSIKKLEQFKSRFPRHSFISLGLEESLKLEGIDWNMLGGIKLAETDSLNKQLQQFIGSMSSPTAQADFISILLTRLLVDVGKNNECESILFGDSTTKLAVKTLTETAKGRGASIPWQVCDGVSPHGLNFHYPLRETLKKELVAFSRMTPLLQDLTIYDQAFSLVSVNSKFVTIDDLMVQYFESVEEDYPSIIANVVKTSGKLCIAEEIITVPCGVCGLPGFLNSMSQNISSDQTSGRSQSIDGLNFPNTLCYGCSTLFDSTNAKNKFHI